MWKTALLLLITVVVIPFFAFRLDEPLTAMQLEVLKDLTVLYIVASALCFILSLITDNYSQVDKLWSTIPIAYIWMVAVKAGFEPRLVLMGIMVTIWGFRLTYNFSRRGGYSLKFWTGE